MWAQSGMNYNSSHRGCAFAWNPAEDSDRILWPRSVSSSPASLDGRSHRGCALAWRSRRGFKSYPLVSFCIFFTGKPRRLVSPRLRLCLEIPQRIQIVSSGLVLYPLHRRTWSVGLTAVAHLLVDPAEDSNRILWPRSVSSSTAEPHRLVSPRLHLCLEIPQRIQIVSSGLVLCPLHRRAKSVGLTQERPGAPRSAPERSGAPKNAQERPEQPDERARRAGATSERPEGFQKYELQCGPQMNLNYNVVPK